MTELKANINLPATLRLDAVIVVDEDNVIQRPATIEDVEAVLAANDPHAHVGLGDGCMQCTELRQENERAIAHWCELHKALELPNPVLLSDAAKICRELKAQLTSAEKRAQEAEQKLTEVNRSRLLEVDAFRARLAEVERERDALRAKVEAWRPVVSAASNQVAEYDAYHARDCYKQQPYWEAARATESAARAIPPEHRPQAEEVKA